MTERQTLTEQIEAVEIAARNYQAQADQSTVNGYQLRAISVALKAAAMTLRTLARERAT